MPRYPSSSPGHHPPSANQPPDPPPDPPIDDRPKTGLSVPALGPEAGGNAAEPASRTTPPEA